MDKGMLIRLGIGTLVMAGAVTTASHVAFSRAPDTPGSTQRFRGVVSEGKAVGGEMAKTKAAARAKVTLEQAVQAVKEKVPGTVLGAELTEKDMAVWDVDILSMEGKEIHLSVDAMTGRVMESE